MTESRMKYKTRRGKRKAWRMTPETMTDADVFVANALRETLERDHRGLRHAIRGEALAKHFNVTYNTIRQCVFYLIETHGVPIGSAVSGPRGYFIIETREEADMSLANKAARATENWVYHNVLARAVERSLHVEVEQLRLGV